MLSRRVFLKNGAFAFVSLGFAPSFMARTAVAASGRSKQLIAIFQRGAVDGLSVIVPHGEGDYYRARPNIAIPKPDGGAGHSEQNNVRARPTEVALSGAGQPHAPRARSAPRCGCRAIYPRPRRRRPNA